MKHLYFYDLLRPFLGSGFITQAIYRWEKFAGGDGGVHELKSQTRTLVLFPSACTIASPTTCISKVVRWGAMCVQPPEHLCDLDWWTCSPCCNPLLSVFISLARMQNHASGVRYHTLTTKELSFFNLTYSLNRASYGQFPMLLGGKSLARANISALFGFSVCGRMAHHVLGMGFNLTIVCFLLVSCLLRLVIGYLRLPGLAAQLVRLMTLCTLLYYAGAAVFMSAYISIAAVMGYTACLCSW